MRKNLKANSIVINSVNPNMETACFENTRSMPISGIEYTDLGEYTGINESNYKTSGNVKLSNFREVMIRLRTSLKTYGEDIENMDSVGFKVHLKVSNEEDSTKPYYITIGVYRKVIDDVNRPGNKKLSDDEYGKIMVLTNIKRVTSRTVGDDGTTENDGEYEYWFGMRNLVVDSDVDDRIWRFVGENEWRSTTYMVLDLNKNLSINKGAYLTLNLPFTNNIGWYEPMRKRVEGWKETAIEAIPLE